MILNGYGVTNSHIAEPSEENDIIIRQSIASSMDLCPARVGYMEHEGYLPVVSEPILFGTFTHSVIEAGLEAENGFRPPLGREELNQILNGVLSEYPPVDGVDAVKDEWFTEVQAAVRLLPLELNMNDIVTFEDTIHMQLGTTENNEIVWLQGTPDAATESVVYDWKTAGRGWDKTQAHYRYQTDLYLALLSYKTGRPYRKFTYLVWNRRKGEWEKHSTERTDAQIESSLKRTYEYGRMIAAEVFPPTPVVTEYFKHKRGWYCSAKYCSAWNVCDFKYLNDDIDESEVAEISL